jgi:hypothetical protein
MSKKTLFPRMLSNLGVSPDDPEDLRLKKNLLVASSLLIGILALLWGVLYLSFGKPPAASIPLRLYRIAFHQCDVVFPDREIPAVSPMSVAADSAVALLFGNYVGRLYQLQRRASLVLDMSDWSISFCRE